MTVALHPTPTLSYGDPPPSYPYLRTADIKVAAQLCVQGRSVHVVDEATAREVLREIGLDPEMIRHRIWVAKGSHYGERGQEVHEEEQSTSV